MSNTNSNTHFPTDEPRAIRRVWWTTLPQQPQSIIEIDGRDAVSDETWICYCGLEPGKREMQPSGSIWTCPTCDIEVRRSGTTAIAIVDGVAEPMSLRDESTRPPEAVEDIRRDANENTGQGESASAIGSLMGIMDRFDRQL